MAKARASGRESVKNDYPKLGVWTDGIYMSANLFGFASGGTFQGVRTWAFNKAQMYAGAPTAQVVSFNAGTGDFTVVPSNARLQVGTPPAGRPNLFVSTWNFTNALTVYKFHVDWNSIGLSTFTGPDVPLAATSWPNAAVANAPQSGTATLLDVLQIRAMVQNQYTNIGGSESLWASHTIRRGNTTGFAAPRWYQVNVTGGTVAANLPQAATWDPDAANVLHRYMPSLALDRAGNMALGYSTSSSTAFPSIAYAGRLAGDPANTFSQTEQSLFAGTASQTGTSRWGDYSSMTLDPDGCTFWYTNQYANPASQAANMRWKTRINSFSYAGIGQCTPVGAGGTVAGTVSATMGGAPISGATVALGARTATTNGAGFYQFQNIPAGTYPSITASAQGYNSSTATSIVVTDGNTTTQNFSLGVAPVAACLTDTTQADFQTGVSTNVDLATSPGDVKLANTSVEGADQVSSPAALSTTNNLSATAWTGQTFRAGITGTLTKITVGLGLASGTSGTITVEIRNLNGANPGTTVLATGTLGPVTNVGTAALYTTTFATPAAVVSGTSYSIVLRTSVGSTVFGVRGSTAGGSTLANGQVFTTTNSGTSWTAIAADLYFTSYVTPPFAYAASGNFVSGTKDANPATGATPHWTTFSWTATTPANTDLKFQVAGSNNVYGPFNFVGPDGTAATFFTTSGATLSQFDGLRYLQYKAYLSTSSTMTPTLNDVTVCFSNITGTLGGGGTICAGTQTNVTVTVSGGTAPYTVVLTNGGGTQTGNGPVFTFPVSPGSDTTYTLAAGSMDANSNPIIGSGNAMVTVNPTPPMPTITPGGPTTFCAGGSVTLTSSSATGNQWYLNGNPIGGAINQAYIATASGNYTVVVTTSGCASVPSAQTVVTVNPIPPTPAITPAGSAAFCTGGSVTLTSSSATGNQWFLNGNPLGGATNQTYVATAAGNYTVTVTASGCTSTPSAPTVVTVSPPPAAPTITPNGTVEFCPGGSVTLTSSSATGNQWFLNGNPINGAINQTYIATGLGNYTVMSTVNGCVSAPSAATTLTPGTVAVNPNTLPGGTIGSSYNQTISATPAGTYNFTVTNGALPTGLTLNAATGVLNGTPTSAGNYGFRITATRDGCSGFRDYTVAIACATVTLTPASLPAGQAGIAYSQTINVSPAGSYAFSLLTGNLPSGLTLNAATGVISGTPSSTTTSTFTIKAETAGGCSGTVTYTLSIGCPAITVNPASLLSGSTGVAYSQTLSATPAGGNYTFALTGSLPPGLSLNPSNGLLTGTPTTNGSYTFTVTATGFGACNGNRSYTVLIGTGSCPTITLPATLPNSNVGQLYSSSVAASPINSYTYTATGNLPPGVTLYEAFGLILGYPTTPGTYTFTITATGSNNCTASQNYTVVVGAGFASSLTVFSDFDSDGKSDLSVFRGSDGNWVVTNSGNGQVLSLPWGAGSAPYNDVPVSGDYDGDGRTDLAVFRRGGGQAGYWYIKRSRDEQVTQQFWGLGTDVPVPGDYDGDGKTDVAVWRGSSGMWHVKRSSDGVESSKTHGRSGDVPIMARKNN